MMDHNERLYYDYAICQDLHDNGGYRWFIVSQDQDRYNFSGPGFDTLAGAKAEVRRRCSCHCGAGPFRSMTTKVNHEMSHN